MLNPFRIADMFRSEESPPPVVYPSHRAYAGNSSIGIGIQAAIQAAVNPFIHHCRIGKITLKTKA